MNLYLTGIMGCGKTTAGQRAAEILGAEFIDVDQEIEKNQNMPIGEIFSVKGEDCFREIESQTLALQCIRQNAIISTGGGIILRRQNINIMKKTGVIVWIKRPIQFILQNIDASVRPLIKDNPQKLIEIYEKREPLYQKYADVTVLNDGSIDEAAQAIVKIMNKKKDSFE